MQRYKDIFVTGFALFAMFFGAGNLILPPNLGLLTGIEWLSVVFGFVLSAVFIPILGIIAHSRLQGTIYDFGKKVSPWFSYLYASTVYLIAITLPAPRTASVTHEMSIAPFWNIPSWITSFIYFGFVLFFVLQRSIILNYLGKYLTPFILLVILSIIGIAFFSDATIMLNSTVENAFTLGVLEGYQTFDAIGAVVVGGVLIISLDSARKRSFKDKKLMIRNAGIIAGVGLLMVYAGMIWVGAHYSQTFPVDISRTDLLVSLSTETLGEIGAMILSVLVALACFTTAVGIVTGTADFVKGIFGNSQLVYTIVAIMGCLLGVLIGQYDVHYIITIAIPSLALIYPVTIVLIFLNVLPEKWASPMVFKIVVLVTVLFSIPDVLKAIGYSSIGDALTAAIPFGSLGLDWVLPASFAFITKNVFRK